MNLSSKGETPSSREHLKQVEGGLCGATSKGVYEAFHMVGGVLKYIWRSNFKGEDDMSFCG
jgi:hypothetical protein